ncbi:ATP-binding protein [Specibacter cremeus]|uniref:ATP-binding protein n=1 Tax=Specibacter cremeus TaxID=1629051 RepID=UPI000F781E42|nr:ATP-binding protein [Specibacter cremeus]
MAATMYRSQDRIIAGVCAGLAAHLGLGVAVVRGLMVAAGFLFGAGVLFYAWLWLFVPMEGEAGAASLASDGGPRLRLFRPAPVAVPGVAVPGSRDVPGSPAGSVVRAPRRGVGEVLVGAGLLLVAGAIMSQSFGLNLPFGTIVPLAVIAGGAFLAWMQLDQTRRTGLLNAAKADTPMALLRLFGGLALVVAGVLVVVNGTGSWNLLWPSVLASLAVLAGVGLVLAPWVLKFWREFQAERAGRIRETERAEIAAHLHDSVLQTLALIQRRAANPQDVTRLARAQERELREWIYQDAGRNAGKLVARIKEVCAEVEDLYGQAVDVVAVGDADLADKGQALVQAVREAVLNGVRHGGTAVSVYVEAGPGGVDVFVKDRGPGFDAAVVPADRLGVRESVIGRMRRFGGLAEIISSPDGTEVRLHLPATDDDE